MFKPTGSFSSRPLRVGAGGECVRAFSLIEVVVALAIFTFAIIGMIGLLPQGLAAQRQSMNATIEAAIVKRILGDARMTTNFTGYTTNFDVMGDPSAVPSYYLTQVTLTNLVNSMMTNTYDTNMTIAIGSPGRTNNYACVLLK